MKSKTMARTRKSKHTDAAMAQFNATVAAESTQWRKYGTGKCGRSGHGFAAEDANAVIDKLMGRKVKKCGADNSPRGADRIVDGRAIQVKYCASARQSVESAFRTPDGKAGVFQYPGQTIEVPADQYAAALRQMRGKIAEGKVPGVTNPDDAVKLVKKGWLTYAESLKAAKAGNWTSVKIDALNNLSGTGVSGGITGVMTLASELRKWKSTKAALVTAGRRAAVSSAKTMACGVATQQILKTGVARSAAAALERTAKGGLSTVMKNSFAKMAVKKTASGMAGKTLGTVAARNALARAASANVITGVVTTAVTSVPDVYHYIKGDISGEDCAKNLASNGAGVAGGMVGGWVGAAIGSIILPGVGTAVGGFIGSILGGAGSSSALRSLFG